jgi:hypothetical protein
MESRLPQVRIRTAKPETIVSWCVNAFSGHLFSTLLFLYRYPIQKYTCINAKNRHGTSKSDHVGDYHTGAHGDPRQL